MKFDRFAMTKSEQQFLQFLSAFFPFQLSFLQLLKKESSYEKLCSTIEMNISSSLSSIWNIHILLISSKSLQSELASETTKLATSSDFDDVFNDNLFILKQIKSIIEQLTFTNKNKQIESLFFIEQMVQLYGDNELPTLMYGDNEKTSPWFSSEILSQIKN